MKKLCPISTKLINEYTCRLNALFTIVVLVLILYAKLYWLLPIISIDLFIRGFIDSQYSLLNQISILIARTIGISKTTNAGPKIFAAQIGFFLSLFAIILFVADFQNIGSVILHAFMAFALLEVAFGFCVACRIYPFIRYIK
jgi:hypothetical protein